MESRDFTFHTYCQKQLSINTSKFSCKFLRGSGANPFLKSYTTILQWSLDGYNTFGKKFFEIVHLLYLLRCKVVCKGVID